jgi:hypothetical protein
LRGAKRKTKRPKRKPSVSRTFLELGRKHFAEDFPNPARQGCPQPAALKRLAESPAQVEGELLDHVTLCSPCYRTYSGFLRKVKMRVSSR